MHFHDLRHTHKTWMIEDSVPEVAEAKRLGHRLPGVRGIYSHVSPPSSSGSSTAYRTDGKTPRNPDPNGDNVRGTVALTGGANKCLKVV